MTESMTKISIYSPGGYEKLVVESIPLPTIGDDDVLVQIKFVGVNYADVCVRWGIYESAKKLVGWPITPGFEFSGEVVQVGRNVSDWSQGDRVMGLNLFNCYASHICVKQDQLFMLPDGFSMQEAAGFPAVFLTAYHALFQIVVIRPSATILIHSAAGGVGTALLQICRLKGWKTIAVVGRSHKVKTALEFGATAVIDKSKQNLWREVERLAPHGCDVIFDPNGAETLSQSYQHLAPMGKLMIYGFHAMMPRQGGRLNWWKILTGYLKIPRFNPLYMTSENKSVVAFNLSFLWDQKPLLNQAMRDLVEWAQQGKLRPSPITIFQFEKAGEAHAALESGQTTGKLILQI